jgi:hypothetical protein
VVTDDLSPSHMTQSQSEIGMNTKEEVWRHGCGLSDETSLEGLSQDGKPCLHSLESIAASLPGMNTTSDSMLAPRQTAANSKELPWQAKSLPLLP